MPATENDNAIRKAAVLIRSLDAEGAAAVLARLSPDEARALRAAVRELGEVTDDDRRGVAEALRTPAVATPSMAPDSKSISRGGVELAIHQPSSDFGTPETYHRMASPASAPAPAAHAIQNDDSLTVLAEADAESLVAYLRPESPQTVAVVLASLPAGRAAEVLAELPGDRQAEVLDRLADLGDADPESLSVITTGLRDWITEQQQRRARRTKSLNTIEAILAAAPREDRERLLESVADRRWRSELPITQGDLTPVVASSQVAEPQPTRSEEPAVRETPVSVEASGPAETSESTETGRLTETSELEAAPPAPLLVTFAEVERLPVAAIAQVMRHASPEHLLLALAGGSEQLLRRIAGTLPRRQAAALRQRVARIGPVRLRDIEHAQESIARVASELLRRGWIRSVATR